MAEVRLRAARALIEERRYIEARQILEGVDHPKAAELRGKLDNRLGVTPTEALSREIPLSTPLPSRKPVTASPVINVYRTQLPTVKDMASAQAQTKSYTGALILVIILYFVFFIPGVIANVLFYEDGRRMEKIAGMPLPGVAALGSLRKIILVIVIILLILFLISTLPILIPYYSR